MIENALLALGFLGSLDGNIECPNSEPYCIRETEIAVDALEERLQGLDETYWVEGNTITIAARREANSVFLCCAIQAPMRQAGDTEFWQLAVTVPRLDEAFIDIIPFPLDEPGRLSPYEALEFRGENALPPVARHQLSSDDIEYRTIESAALGVSRRFSIYIPPELQDAPDRPVIYMADGQGTLSYAQILQSLIIECRIEPLMIVGLWHGEYRDDVTPQQLNDQRSEDYLWGYGDNRFEDHEEFFRNEVMPLVEAEYQVSSRPPRRVLFGVSSGGAWALSTGLRHPTDFGVIGAVSTVYGQSLEAASPQSGPRYYFSIGLFEDRAPPLLDEIGDRFEETSVDFRQQVFVSGHSPLVAFHAFEELLLSEFPTGEKTQCRTDD